MTKNDSTIKSQKNNEKKQKRSWKNLSIIRLFSDIKTNRKFLLLIAILDVLFLGSLYLFNFILTSIFDNYVNYIIGFSPKIMLLSIIVGLVWVLIYAFFKYVILNIFFDKIIRVRKTSNLFKFYLFNLLFIVLFFFVASFSYIVIAYVIKADYLSLFRIIFYIPYVFIGLICFFYGQILFIESGKIFDSFIKSFSVLSRFFNYSILIYDAIIFLLIYVIIYILGKSFGLDQFEGITFARTLSAIIIGLILYLAVIFNRFLLFYYFKENKRIGLNKK